MAREQIAQFLDNFLSIGLPGHPKNALTLHTWQCQSCNMQESAVFHIDIQR